MIVILINIKINNNSFLAIYDGYPTFVISILFIGLCTAVIGDVAGHLGCFIYLKDCVNAIAFVALGTSVPGTEWVLCWKLSLDSRFSLILNILIGWLIIERS